MKTMLKTLTALVLANAPAQAYEWTDWRDSDDPSGSRDIERLSSHISQLGIECDSVVAVQARRISDKVLAEETGEVITLNTDLGFQCVNANQPDGACDDYEMRFACAQWSAWLDRDDGGTGDNDNETINKHTNEGSLDCDEVVDVEARRVADQLDATQTGQILTLDTTTGLKCKYSLQSNYRCDDYEVRYLCGSEFDTTADVEGYTESVANSFSNGADIEYSGDAQAGIRLGGVVTDNGTFEAAVRMDPSGRVKVDQVGVESGGSAFERVDVIAIMGDLADHGIHAETGTLSVGNDGTTFEIEDYTHPLVFLQVASNNGSNPVVANATLEQHGRGGTFDYDAGAFSPADFTVHVDLAEPSNQDGVHGTAEVVQYLVIEAGTYTLNDYGKTLVAGLTWGSNYVDNDDELQPGQWFQVSKGDLGYDAEMDDSAVVIARPQGGTGWRAARAVKNTHAGRTTSISVMLEENSGSAAAVAFLILADDYQESEFDEDILDQCGLGASHTGNQYFMDAGNYGNNTIGASHYLAAGIQSVGDYTWSGAAANLSATLFGESATLIGAELSASKDDGAVSSRMYFEVLGSVQVDDPIGVNTDWSTSATFFEASATFYGVTVRGELVGTIGVEASAEIGGLGVAINGTPYLDVTASASAGVGGWCLSAGVGADLSIASISVPTDATLGLAGSDIAWEVSSQVEMSTLDGKIYLYVDYCLGSEEYEIFSWDGIALPTIQLIDASGCL